MNPPSWNDFTRCAICTRRFKGGDMLPVTLSCCHTVCIKCLKKQKGVCPLDRALFKTPVDKPPVNPGIVKVLNIDDPLAITDPTQFGLKDDELSHYRRLCSAMESIALLLSPLVDSGLQGVQVTCLSRPILKKVAAVLNVPLFEVDGRLKAMRLGKSIAERLVVELLNLHQKKQELSSQLWAALRQRGCQFLGPFMQYAALKAILKVLETGSFVSRKNIISFVVQRLEPEYPTASRTSVGHVVQLLYRASCFTVDKREQDSSLLQLKDQFRTYENLRREHDTQVVKISMDAGLRIGPEQLANMLYNSSLNKSYIQSIIDKLIASRVVPTGINELKVVLERVEDSDDLSSILVDLESLVTENLEDKSEDSHLNGSFECCANSVEALKNVLLTYVDYYTEKLKKQHGPDVNVQQVLGSRYKTGMCREFQQKGRCSRGSECTYAHSTEELQRYRDMAIVKGPKTPAGVQEGYNSKAPVSPSHAQSPSMQTADISQGLGRLSVSSPDPGTHDGRSTMHTVDRGILDKAQLTSIKHFAGSPLTGSDPGLLAVSGNEYSGTTGIKSYSSDNDLHSHHSADVNMSLSDECLDMQRRKLTLNHLTHPSSAKRPSLPLATEAYSPHPLTNYSMSASRGVESHHSDPHEPHYFENGRATWTQHTDPHTVHRLPAGSEPGYRLVQGSPTPVHYKPNYLHQYRSVVTSSPGNVVSSTAPFYPQYHVSPVAQQQQLSVPHPGIPVYRNLTPISDANMMPMDPRLPQMSLKPPAGDYNSFPVYVDPSYYTTYP